ncbi:MAG: peptidoglycan DD-metalloendopeptidase family protein [Aquabacterium sp.]
MPLSLTWFGGRHSAALTALLLALLAGCAGPRAPAPVETRSPAPRAMTPPAAAVPAPAAPTPSVAPSSPAPAADVRPVADNAGKPGFYVVRPGDTLIRIALDHGQNWRDVARWSGLDNPNLIEVGQALRVVPPGVDPNVAVTRPVAGARAEARPLDSRPAAMPPVPAGSASAPAAPTTAGGSTPTTAPASTPVVPRDADADLDWLWPAAGPLLAGFEEGRSKGLVLGGKAGDAVLAAADGRVVYAGSGLRGYGNLVIVKHNASYLTAYAHNQLLLVKEDQAVKRGQKIAEMGSSDAERVQLHFEIRRQGKPVDPARLLPAR